jgi:hypothetical protein
MRVLGAAIDERFLQHRLRSTSVAGMAGCLVAMGLFVYHVYADRVWSWELLSIGIVMVVVKLSLLSCYRLTD